MLRIINCVIILRLQSVSNAFDVYNKGIVIRVRQEEKCKSSLQYKLQDQHIQILWGIEGLQESSHLLIEMIELATKKTESVISAVIIEGTHSRPVVIDMFAGAGGLSQGFIDAGFCLASAVDTDHWASTTHTKNHGCLDTPIDIIECSIKDVRPERLLTACKQHGALRPDVLMGGPPCQGFSRSNMRTRTADNPLNYLFREFLRFVEILRPRIFLLENVADFAKFNKGAIADEIRRIFAEMNIKYELMDPTVLCAADYGVPQRRNRVFFVAVEHGLHFEFPEPKQEPHVRLWDAISDLPRLKNGNRKDMCYYRTPPQNQYQQLMRARTNRSVSNNLVSLNSDLIIKRYGYIRQGQNWEAIPEELMANYTDKSRTHNWIYLRLKECETSVTITHFRKSMLIHPRQNRGLSVREAARIQSFPDDFVFCGPLMYQQQQVANAVPPLLAKAIAYSIRDTLGF